MSPSFFRPEGCQSSCTCVSANDCPVIASDRRRRVQQQAGLNALIAMAAQASVGMADPTATTVIYRARLWVPDREAVRDSYRDADKAGRSLQAADTPRARPSAMFARLMSDTMVRNSLALMLSSALQASLGFAFWILMAHLFTTSDVGIASSLISATTLIAYFALAGMNTTLVRFLPSAQDVGTLITAALLLVTCCAAVIGSIYLLLTPIVAPRLSFIEHSPVEMAGFVVLTAAAAVNLLTDSVFMAARKAGYCALTDGAVGGISKIIAGVLLAGTGAFGLFSASVGGFAAAAVCSLALIVTALHWHPSIRSPVQVLKPLFRFSSANYAANALNLLPSVIVPVIVLDRLGAQSAAYYFVAFQIAALLYAAVYAVESAFFAEGSQAGSDWRSIRRRSMRLAMTLFIPAGVVLALASHWIMLAFGSQYSHNASASLELLAAAVVPMAICSWSWTVLKLSGRLTMLVFSNAVYALGVCSSAWVMTSRGLTAMSAAWFVGATLGAVAATVPASTASRKTPAHRKIMRSRPTPLT